MTSSISAWRASHGGRPGLEFLGFPLASGSEQDAGRPLWPRAHHHHCANGHPAVGRRFCVHGAALNTVTRRLSAAVTQDIAAMIDIYRTFPQDADSARLRRIAQERLGLVVDFLPATEMPPPGPKPFFSLLDQALSEEIRADRPALLDRYSWAFVARGNPHPARQCGDARVRTPQCGLARRIPKSSCCGWSAHRSCCLRSRSYSCAIRSGRSCGLRMRPRVLAKAAKSSFSTARRN